MFFQQTTSIGSALDVPNDEMTINTDQTYHFASHGYSIVPGVAELDGGKMTAPAPVAYQLVHVSHGFLLFDFKKYHFIFL